MGRDDDRHDGQIGNTFADNFHRRRPFPFWRLASIRFVKQTDVRICPFQVKAMFGSEEGHRKRRVWTVQWPQWRDPDKATPLNSYYPQKPAFHINALRRVSVCV